MDPTVASQAAELALQVLTPILVALAAWLAHRIVGVFEKKTGIDIPEKQEAQIDKWIEAGIHLAEEKSRSLVKSKASKLEGPQKLEVAGTFVMGMISKNGWDDWAQSWILDKIEAQLGTNRANGGKPTPSPLPEVVK